MENIDLKRYEEFVAKVTSVESSKSGAFYGRVQELEGKKLCECAPEAEYKTTPREVFVTNYDEDDTCLTCSA